MNRSPNNQNSRGQSLRIFTRAFLFAAAALPSVAYADGPATATSTQTATKPADTATKPAETPVVQQAEQPKTPPPAPYNIPFELRGVTPARIFRIDTSLATFHSTKGADPTVVSFFNLGYAFTPEIGLVARIGYLNGGTPATDQRGSIFSNPALVAVYAPKLFTDWRLSGALAVVAPLGGGGGDTPDPKSKLARTGAVLTRSAMQNAMFSANDLGIAPGIDIAYVKSGVTLQLEATVIFAFRMRGENEKNAAGLELNDSSKINFTSGLHFGYFLAPWISIGTELRYQRWINPPKVAVDLNPQRDLLMDTMSLAVGPRFHIKLSDKSWFRPGITYTRGLDDPMSAADYQIVQLDLPFTY